MTGCRMATVADSSYQIPRIIGHRGAAKAAPENTLEGLREAKRQGAAWVEVDAKLTADNAVILLHDDLLDRTTSGKGAAAQVTLEQIRALDAGLGWRRPSPARSGPDARGDGAGAASPSASTAISRSSPAPAASR